MTILELTQLVNAQDDRWARILTYNQSTRNPAAHVGIAFFKRTWRPALTTYYEGVAGRYEPSLKVPAAIASWWLDALSSVIYPAARKVGFSDNTFLFPDIAIEQSGRPAAPPPAPPNVATLGAEPPRGQSPTTTGTVSGWSLLVPMIVGGGLLYWMSRPSSEEREMEKSMGPLDRKIDEALGRRHSL
jgi:hypothetical protein